MNDTVVRAAQGKQFFAQLISQILKLRNRWFCLHCEYPPSSELAPFISMIPLLLRDIGLDNEFEMKLEIREEYDEDAPLLIIALLDQLHKAGPRMF